MWRRTMLRRLLRVGRRVYRTPCAWDSAGLNTSARRNPAVGCTMPGHIRRMIRDSPLGLRTTVSPETARKLEAEDIVSKETLLIPERYGFVALTVRINVHRAVAGLLFRSRSILTFLKYNKEQWRRFLLNGGGTWVWGQSPWSGGQGGVAPLKLKRNWILII